MIKKVLLTAFVVVSMLVPALAAAPAYAVDILNPTGAGSGPCNNGNATSKPAVCTDNRSGSNTNPIYGKNGVLTSVINILSIVIGVVSVVIIVVEGIRMIVGAGDAGAVSTARRGIVYAVAGLVVAGVSQAIVGLILSRLD